MDKKKLAAAISAVTAYIKTSEEAAAFASQSAVAPVLGHKVVQQANLADCFSRSAQDVALTIGHEKFP